MGKDRVGARVIQVIAGLMTCAVMKLDSKDSKNLYVFFKSGQRSDVMGRERRGFLCGIELFIIGVF